ncbi:hypothetical protein ANCCAN_29503 [Ancylostoma caninum]|uniref:Uncharacterized protein n=1 Tax=Ancylostoma caninum TaxID=29170 RepID=A0A368EYA5_ANCCA|nr:hypothetical protein ANCCAN_29503 [Ancylostoma caninum]
MKHEGKCNGGAHCDRPRPFSILQRPKLREIASKNHVSSGLFLYLLGHTHNIP